MAKLTQKAVSAALMNSHGNISAAARALGVDRRSIAQRIEKDPDLGQAVINARESMVDNAESSLARAVISGEAWAVCFTLKTQGKSRGYIERYETTGKDGGPIEFKDVSDDQLDAEIAELERAIRHAAQGATETGALVDPAAGAADDGVQEPG